MGSATVIANLGDGLYQIRRQQNIGLDQELAKLASRRADLETDLPVLKNTLSQYWDELTAYRAAADALIEQWKNGTLPMTGLPQDPTDPDGNPISGPAYCDAVISLVNQVRNAEGLSTLTQNAALTQSAQNHSTWMAMENTLSHTGQGGSTPEERIRDAGYLIYGFGENVGGGADSPEKIMDEWMHSAPHRANILEPRFKEIGVGLALTPTGLYRYWWVQNFGAQN